MIVEGLTDEVMFLVEKSDDGMTLGDLYDASVLADSQQAVAGAVHRLVGQRLLVRGTDKRVRTPDQTAKSAAPPPASSTPPASKKLVKKKAARKKAAAKPAQPTPPRVEPTDSLLEDIEQASVDAQVRLDRYLSQIHDPLLDSLIEAANAAQTAAAAARQFAKEAQP